MFFLFFFCLYLQCLKEQMGEIEAIESILSGDITKHQTMQSEKYPTVFDIICWPHPGMYVAIDYQAKLKHNTKQNTYKQKFTTTNSKIKKTKKTKKVSLNPIIAK